MAAVVSRPRAVAAVTLLLVIAGCSRTGTLAGASPSAGVTGEVTVFAAASLKSPFTRIGDLFEAAHPGTRVRFSFAGSSDLLAQLQQGAPADVFAAADTRTMTGAVSDGLTQAPPTDFATNTMAIAVPPGNPEGIQGFADLAGPGLQVVVCAVPVPCGAATTRVEASTGVTLTPVSEESSVAGVLEKVATGEADAGVVYVTDVSGSGGKVQGVPIPAPVNAVTTYPIAVLAGARAPELAREFEALVLGPPGQQVLADAGFGAP